MKIKITLLEEILGTKSANEDVFTDYIASKHPSGTPQKDELDSIEHKESAGTTIFSRVDGKPGIWNYQIKGFFKDACGALRRADDTKSKELKAYKTVIDGNIFVNPRFIPFILPEGGAIGVCERPLRAETAQGPRVSVCRSETVPSGTIMELEIKTLASKLNPLVEEWLNYGQLRGLGCWRNSGKGIFTWEEIK
jgi:hypothetical protein